MIPAYTASVVAVTYLVAVRSPDLQSDFSYTGIYEPQQSGLRV